MSIGYIPPSSIDMDVTCSLPSFEEALEHWVSIKRDDLNRYNNYLKARDHMIEAKRDPTQKLLDLSYLTLDSLPAVINELRHITSLNLVGNEFMDVPSAIFGMKNLTYLDLRENKISFLPDYFNCLPSLNVLILCNNSLTFTPLSLTTLSELRVLDLQDNKLSKVPLELAQLPSVCRLDISNNNFTAEDFELLLGKIKQQRTASFGVRGPELGISPELLGSLQVWCHEATQTEEYPRRLEAAARIFNVVNNCEDQSERELNLSNLGLTSLPKLQHDPQHELFFALVDLSGNQLTDFPDDFISNVCELNLANNNFEFLPEAVYDYSDLCILDLTRNPLRELPVELAHIENITFDHSDAIENLDDFMYVYDLEHSGELEKNTIEKALKFWLDTASLQPYASLINHRNKDDLKKFLNRLTTTHDYQSSTATESVRARVIQMLQGASQNEVFREAIFSVLESASSTCSDRISESFDTIEILWQIHINSPTMDDQQLANLVIGLDRKNELDKIAIERFGEIEKEYKQKTQEFRSKGLLQEARDLPKPDQLETVLAYRIGLRDKLGLPTSTHGMNYPANGYVTSDDLAKAEKKIPQEEKKMEILLQSDVWRDRIRAKYPKEFDELSEEIMGLSGSEIQNQVQAAELTYSTMEKLTRKMLVQSPG